MKNYCIVSHYLSLRHALFETGNARPVFAILRTPIDHLNSKFIHSEFSNSEFIHSEFIHSKCINSEFMNSKFLNSKFNNSEFIHSEFDNSEFINLSFGVRGESRFHRLIAFAN